MRSCKGAGAHRSALLHGWWRLRARVGLQRARVWNHCRIRLLATGQVAVVGVLLQGRPVERQAVRRGWRPMIRFEGADTGGISGACGDILAESITSLTIGVLGAPSLSPPKLNLVLLAPPGNTSRPFA